MILVLVTAVLTCVWSDATPPRPPPKHSPFGTKARYANVAGNITEVNFGACTPLKVYALHRHGTRSIGQKTVRRIDTFVAALKEFYLTPGVMPAEYAWIRDFQHNLHPNKDLVLEGYLELAEMGKRFSARFPDLFYDDSDSHVQMFASSYKGRCISSALSYLHAVYGGEEYVVNNSSGIIRDTPDIRRHCGKMCQVYDLLDPQTSYHTLNFTHTKNKILRYFGACDNYVSKENDKDEWSKVSERYLKNKPMVELANTLSTRLNVTLSAYDVVTLHVLCDTEVLVPRLMGQVSRWCDVFKDNELYQTAFYFDLRRYARRMMPEAVNASCILWQDVLSFLHSYKKGVNINFAHGETLFPLLQHIGYLTEPMSLSADLLLRQFFGDLVPMGSNLAVVLLHCPPDDDAASPRSGFIVKFFLNEKEIFLPRCGEVCYLDKLAELFPVSGCNFDQICSYDAFSMYIQYFAAVVVSICLADVIKRKILL